MKVRDVMTRNVITIRRGDRLREAAETLITHRISGLPVLDDAGVCVGVLSEADLLAKQLNRSNMRRTPLDWILGERTNPEERRRRSAITVEQAMSSPAVTIGEDRSLREAAAVMVDRDVNRLPVVSGAKVVGIVTRADLVRAYLRRDEDISNAILEDVLRRTMWVDPDAFDISVSDGVVRIAGMVDRRSTARIIERLARLVEGVVRVESHIGWERDDTNLTPPAPGEREPGAASLTARDRPQRLHR